MVLPVTGLCVLHSEYHIWVWVPSVGECLLKDLENTCIISHVACFDKYLVSVTTDRVHDRPDIRGEHLASRQLDNKRLVLTRKFELDDGACWADDVLLDDLALDADTIVVAGTHQPIAHAHLERQVDGPARRDVAHNTAVTRLLGGLLQRHTHTTGRLREVVGDGTTSVGE